MTTTGTDYAKCQRLPVETSGVYANKSWYWLRSATTETTESSMNYAQVAMDCSYESTMDVKYVYGIRPAINLPL